MHKKLLLMLPMGSWSYFYSLLFCPVSVFYSVLVVHIHKYVHFIIQKNKYWPEETVESAVVSAGSFQPLLTRRVGGPGGRPWESVLVILFCAPPLGV